MANSQSVLELLIKADTSQAEAGLSGLTDKLGKFQNKVTMGVAGVAAAGIAVAGKAIWDLTMGIDAAGDAIVAGTRASGAALQEMTDIAVDLSASVGGLGRSMEDVGKVIAEVNTRTGATGDSLESFTDKILKMGNLTGVDGVEAVQLVTRTMGDWGIAMEDSGLLMDKLYSSTQVFGISLPAISAKLVQFGAPLRQMGFTIDESIALLGKWEKEGVNTELVLGSLRIAAGKFAEQGIDLSDGLEQVSEAIKNAASDSDALSIAMDTFGARAGADMAAAIREGRFEIDEYMKAMEGAGGAIDETAEAQLGLAEQFELSWKRVRNAFQPVGELLLKTADEQMPAVEQAAEDLAVWLEEELPGALDTMGEQWAKEWEDIESLSKIVEGAMNEDWATFWDGMDDIFSAEGVTLFKSVAEWYTWLSEQAKWSTSSIAQQWADLMTTLQEHWAWLQSHQGVDPMTGLLVERQPNLAIINPQNVPGAIVNPMNLAPNSGQPAPVPSTGPQFNFNVTVNGNGDAPTMRRGVLEALRAQGYNPQ